MNQNEMYDLIIIGSGPAGLTASIYASRAMLNSVTFERLSFGGQVMTTTEIDNYPGVPNTDGFTLSSLMHQQASDLGSCFVNYEITGLQFDPEDKHFTIIADKEYRAKSVIVATGATPRPAGFVGEQEFKGKGVSYCGNCDGMFYRNKDVYVIGGGNTALEEALFLSNIAKSVTILVRKDHFRAQKALQDKVFAKENISVKWNTQLLEVQGENSITNLILQNTVSEEVSEVNTEEKSTGVFVFVGHNPVVNLLGELVDYSQSGAVITDEWMKTKTPGLFCAGDLRQAPIRQIVTAAADGAIAATAAASYLGHHVNT